jgi:hypothetical protein
MLGAVLFFTFYWLLIYDTRGYIVASIAPLCAYGVLASAHLAAESTKRRSRRIAVTALALMITTPIVSPPPTKGALHGEYSRHDAMIRARISPVRANFDPARTVLVTSLEYWTWGLRHVGHALPEFTTVQLATDPLFAIVTPEKPYLATRAHNIWSAGPDPLALDLVLAQPDLGVSHVVYMIPGDMGTFVDRSCVPFQDGVIEAGEQGQLPFFTLEKRARIAISRQRLVCERL